jgi:putative ABC transport system permease protein
MIAFLFKGILRDRSRSLFPLLSVAAGVFLTVGIYCYLKGGVFIITRTSANLDTGHVKVMTRAYAQESNMAANDAALTGVSGMVSRLEKEFPDLDWAPRIRFGGLLDVPDENGETKTQGAAAGFAADLLSPESRELARLDLAKGLIRGRLPERPDEILVGEVLAERLGLRPGRKVTLISSTRHGNMALANFSVAGTVSFGVRALDRTGVVADLQGIRTALDMEDAAGEVLGFFKDSLFDNDRAEAVAAAFKAKEPARPADDFGPVLLTLRDQNRLGEYLDYLGAAQAVIIAIFVFPMSLVLWNAGLVGNLRRYGEIGVRLAMGETKGHIYRSLLAESLMIGVLGTVLGTALGLAVGYYLQAHGINIGSFFKNASIMIPNTIYARVTPLSYVIGLGPGLLATFIGTAIAGRGIYKRQTAQLFKELET